MNLWYKTAVSALALVLSGCAHIDNPKTGNVAAGLPKFDLVESEGGKVESQQFADKRVLVMLFEVNSVYAWRRLAEFASPCSDQQVRCLAIAGTKTSPGDQTDINSLKQQYRIGFPIVPDPDSRVPTVFGVPGCCDYVLLYDAHGNLKHLGSLHSEASSIISQFSGDKPSQSNDPEDFQPLPSAELSRTVRITTASGIKGTVPFAKRGFTVINLFDQFCTECATGERLETLKRLARTPGSDLKISAVFSEKNFSFQDIENFRSMLRTEYQLYQGDLGSAADAMIGGRLLLVFDHRGALVWQEKPHMTEEAILQAVTHLENPDRLNQ